MMVRIAPILLCLTVMLPSVGSPQDESGQQHPHGSGYDEKELLHVNRDFFELATATGGDFYFWAPGEFSSASLRVPIEREPILLASGELDGGIRVFDVPVDSTVGSLAVFVGAQLKLSFALLRPDGVVVNAAHEGVDLQRYQHMLIVTVSQPDAGMWQVEAQGRGAFALSVRAGGSRSGSAVEPISLIHLGWVEMGGRPGHEGFFESTAPIRAGQQRLCSAVLSGSWETASLQLLSEAGEPLSSFELESDVSDLADGDLLASWVVPKQRFRAAVIGTDVTGARFQRVHAALFDPE